MYIYISGFLQDRTFQGPFPVFPKGLQAMSAKMAEVEIYVCHFHFMSAKLKTICKFVIFLPIF